MSDSIVRRMLAGEVIERKAPPLLWRTGQAGYTHAYRSDRPEAIPSCSTNVPYRTTEPAIEGIRRCKTCVRNLATRNSGEEPR